MTFSPSPSTIVYFKSLTAGHETQSMCLSFILNRDWLSVFGCPHFKLSDSV